MKRLFILILALMLVVFPSCEKEDAAVSDTYFSFTDDAGREITLEKKPEKVAALFSSYAEMVLLSGGTVSVTVGESIERGFASENTFLVDGGAGKKINNELLLSSGCDFVIGSLDIAQHNKTAELLLDAGVPTALFKVESFEDYERVMKILCGIFESDEKYKENVTLVRDGIEKVLSQIPKEEPKKILFVRCASSAKATKAKTKDNNFVCRMLTQMNTYNIAENAPLLLDTLSIEEILLWDPDYIFFSPMGDEDAAKEYVKSLVGQKEWQMLSAVKNENYTFLDKNLFQYKPNNRWDEAYRILAELLYGKE